MISLEGALEESIGAALMGNLGSACGKVLTYDLSNKVWDCVTYNDGLAAYLYRQVEAVEAALND